MKTFQNVHQKQILGQITMFDRMILRGHLLAFYPHDGFRRFLSSQKILLKDFGPYVQQMTGILKNFIEKLSQDAGRPLKYLASAMTKARGTSKEDLARAIAEEDGIREGLICVFSTVEPCRSFAVKGVRATEKLEVVRQDRKCLHYYFYYLDREFGFMHVRLQSWFPFQIQLYINGREWLSRQMDQRGIGYQRYENTFLAVEDLEAVQRLCQKFLRRQWVRLLDAFARKVNPFLPLIRKAGFGRYWWVLDQAEIATDLMFRDRGELGRLLPGILQYAMRTFSCEDVLRFLGKKLNGNFQGQLTSDLKKRPEGYRVKHRAKGNSLKVYDKWSVLRVETTICQPREFKVLRVIRKGRRKPQRKWQPMGKGVANIGRYFQVGHQVNERYLEALAQVTQRDKAVKELDGLCQAVKKDGRRYARLQPLGPTERDAFRAILSGNHLIQGFRNGAVREALFGHSENLSLQETRRRCARVSRLLQKLRGHGLIYRVRDSHLHRVTCGGYRIMSAVLAFHDSEFSESYAAAS
jgi:hypothetical protein